MAARPKAELMTQSDAARHLGTSRQNISNHVARGNLDKEEFAGVPFVTRASVERLARRRTAMAKARATR